MLLLYSIKCTVSVLLLVSLLVLHTNWRIFAQFSVPFSSNNPTSSDGRGDSNTIQTFPSVSSGTSDTFGTKNTSSVFLAQQNRGKYLLRILEEKRKQLQRILAIREYEYEVRFLGNKHKQPDRFSLTQHHDELQVHKRTYNFTKSSYSPDRNIRRYADAPDAKHSLCSSMALMHGRRTETISSIYNQTGYLPWLLVDAFVTRRGNPCSYNADCEEVLPVATIVITAKVYQTAKFGLSHRQEKYRKAKEYTDLHSDTSASWRCEYGKYGTFDALRTLGDGDKHTLVIRCPLPKVVLATGHDGEGRIRQTLAVSISNASHCYLGFQNIPLCDSNIVETDDVESSQALAACTMIKPAVQGKGSIDIVSIVLNWVRYMMASGFSFVVIYIDSLEKERRFHELQNALHSEAMSLRVKLIHFHLLDGYPFQTQSAQENHCQWRLRGSVSWLAHLDVDEYLQPLGHFKTIYDVISHHQRRAHGQTLAAVQAKNLFWDHHPDLEANWSLARADVWNMQWRDAQGVVQRGREKIICNPALVDYVSVHRVTTGGRTIQCHPVSELRHNHFSRHLKGYDLRYACGSQHSDKRCANAMRNPVHDDSFYQHYVRVMSNYLKRS
eukprot:m.1639047 g.1639047  ORF g.1639047 m.1639047 type:complete len:610 (-) comp32751_c0_seq1:198-2027(-)